MVIELFRELSSLPQIEAIALGGSRAGSHYDENSDYDVYLYCTEPVEETVRRNILAKYCSYMEIGNQFWETEDNCTLKNGTDIDILYRDFLEVSPGREATCRAVFGTWGFFPDDARASHCPFVLTSCYDNTCIYVPSHVNP